jgi:hypothetical protein
VVHPAIVAIIGYLIASAPLPPDAFRLAHPHHEPGPRPGRVVAHGAAPTHLRPSAASGARVDHGDRTSPILPRPLRAVANACERGYGLVRMLYEPRRGHHV